MAKSRGGSSETSAINRKVARRKGYTGTNQAREAGESLPTRQELDDAALDSTRPAVNIDAQAKRAVQQPPKKGTK